MVLDVLFLSSTIYGEKLEREVILLRESVCIHTYRQSQPSGSLVTWGWPLPVKFIFPRASLGGHTLLGPWTQGVCIVPLNTGTPLRGMVSSFCWNLRASQMGYILRKAWAFGNRPCFFQLCFCKTPEFIQSKDLVEILLVSHESQDANQQREPAEMGWEAEALEMMKDPGFKVRKPGFES